jgi:hypothetical protein
MVMFGYLASNAAISFAVFAPSDPRPPLTPPCTANTTVSASVGTGIAGELATGPLLDAGETATLLDPATTGADPVDVAGEDVAGDGAVGVDVPLVGLAVGLELLQPATARTAATAPQMSAGCRPLALSVGNVIGSPQVTARQGWWRRGDDA